LPTYVLVIEKKTGVDSWPLLLLAEQGVLGLFAYSTAFWLSLKRSRTYPVLFAMIISILVISSIQSGYILLYHIWAFIGMGLHGNYKTGDINYASSVKNANSYT
jgi:hypothetical protein